MIQEILSKLQELQETLVQKYEIENELLEIPKILNTKTELVSRLKQSYVDKNEQLIASQKMLRELKVKMLDAEREREGYEERMGDISTQREYEALIKEIRLASESEQNYRKDFQREEKFIEELQQNIELEEELITEQSLELEAEQEKNKKEVEKRQKLLKKLGKREDSITPGVDEEIIFKFKRIIRSKGGKGIVPLNRSVCTGCNMILPAQFVNEVRAETEVRFCPYCSMILYHQPDQTEDDVMLDDFLLSESDEFSDNFDDIADGNQVHQSNFDTDDLEGETDYGKDDDTPFEDQDHIGSNEDSLEDLEEENIDHSEDEE